MNIDLLYNFVSRHLGKCDFCDRKFLEELSYVLKLSFGLGSYFYGIELKDLSNKKALALYQYRTGKVNLDINCCKKYISEIINTFDKQGKTELCEYHIYSILLHEIIHACQYMFLNSNIDNINRVLLIDSLKVLKGNFNLSDSDKENIFNSSKANNIYTKYHSYFPIEREANLVSDNIMKGIYSNITNKDVLLRIQNDYLKANLYPYVNEYKLTSPTKEFYRIIGREDKFRKLNYDYLNLNDRFELGLPINMEEFARIIDENSTNLNRNLSIKFNKNSFKIV